MIRGLSFKVPNKRFPVIYIILKNVEIKKFFWFIVEEDVIDNFFENDRYKGVEFEKIINDETCYAIFLNLQAYVDENSFTEIKNYDDFTKSKCKMVLFISDNSYIDVYVKDKFMLEIIKKNAEDSNFKNIRYITDENDKRKGFRA